MPKDLKDPQGFTIDELTAEAAIGETHRIPVYPPGSARAKRADTPAARAGLAPKVGVTVLPDGTEGFDLHVGAGGVLSEDRPVFVVTRAPFNADRLGVSDSTAAFVGALGAAKAANGVMYVPTGTYLVDGDALSVGADEACAIVGEGRRLSVIKARTAGTMLDFTRASGFTGMRMAHIGLDGDNMATLGLRLQRVNLSRLDSVEVRNVNGIGLELDGVQDVAFFDMDVRNCGVFATTLPGVKIHSDAVETNSLVFHGGTFERNRYHQVLIDAASAVKILGSKLHGRTTADDTTPEAVDLLHCLGARRCQAIGCQFTHGRRYGVFMDADAGAIPSSVTLLGNTFADPANYQTGGEAWNIVAAASRFVADGNHFFFGDHASYTTDGGDIWLQSTALYHQGANHHHANAGTPIKSEVSAPNRIRPLHAYDFYAESTFQPYFQCFVDGESNARIDMQTAQLRFGSGSAAPDTIIQRVAANVAGMASGDSFDLPVRVFTDATRPAAGTAGHVIFNSTDGNLNIDNGTDWILPDGTVT